jgi:CRISPR system Cascade subunit CasB
MHKGKNMKVRDSTSSSLPDFVDLHQRFKQLENGPKAELRRVASLEDIASIPAYYRWLGGRQPSTQLERIAFLVPFVDHNAEAEPLGRQLFKRNVSEMRLFQMLRAEPPRDLEHLRRLLRHLDQPALNWQGFGRTLFYWGPNSKRSILQSYFTTESK